METLNFFKRTLQMYPSPTASEMLDEACSVLPNVCASVPVQDKAEALLTSLDGPILERLQQLVHEAGGQIERLSVVSPFFDQHSTLLSQILARLKPQRIDVYLQNDRSNVPIREWLHWARTHPGRLQTFAVSFDEKEKRFLHAKCIIASGQKSEWLLFGSPNFTTAALNADYRNGNIEIAVLKVVPRRRQTLLTQLFGGYVTATPIDLRRIPAIQPEPTTFPAAPRPWAIHEARLVHHKIELHVSRPGEETPLPRARLWSHETEQTVLQIAEDRGTRLLTEAVPREERLFRSPVLV